VLVEAGYMSNQEEGMLLREDSFKTVVAEAIYNGLQNYYKNENNIGYTRIFSRVW
jgi:N-acetylmuramoyl-L-alanine amidase